MYLGIDFLIAPDLRPYVVEVNQGLPGGAQEYDLTCIVYKGCPSNVFRTVDDIAYNIHGKTFREYLYSLPWLESLKAFKLWLDGAGQFSHVFHPALRLEDKWVQYQILSPLVPMPETRVLGPESRTEAVRFLADKGRLVRKRRLGRGGRGFRLVDGPEDLGMETHKDYGDLLQEWVDSRVGPYVLSIRSVAFGGHHICMYANLASRPHSNHGVLAYVDAGDRLMLGSDEFDIRAFNQKSWEADIWFGKDEPAYLRHNLYEDEVATTALLLPGNIIAAVKDISVRIERFYETLDLTALPSAFFE
jgi:hypothetical protein